MAVKKQRRRRITIGVFGTILLGTIGSLIANIISGMPFKKSVQEIFPSILKFLRTPVQIWIMMLVVAFLLFISVVIIKTRKKRVLLVNTANNTVVQKPKVQQQVRK